MKKRLLPLLLGLTAVSSANASQASPTAEFTPVVSKAKPQVKLPWKFYDNGKNTVLINAVSFVGGASNPDITLSTILHAHKVTKIVGLSHAYTIKDKNHNCKYGSKTPQKDQITMNGIPMEVNKTCSIFNGESIYRLGMAEQTAASTMNKLFQNNNSVSFNADFMDYPMSITSEGYKKAATAMANVMLNQ